MNDDERMRHPTRCRAVRSTLRHRWEKERTHADLRERRSTGATEQETGLPTGRLAFRAVYDRVEASADLAAALGVGTGTALLRRTYRTRPAGEGTPLNVCRSCLPYALAARNPELFDASNEPWPGGTMHQLSTVGVEVARVEEVVTARPPTDAEARELGLAPGVPVMEIRKTLHDVSGQVVEVADILLPGDRYAVRCVTRL
ncbi:UTRA domain-containing protein [Streptomyces sp. WAC00469]|uniref:UTRA domain-containing protein n=1 Tax=Streptomyces sp. WAC00469 TaxID=2487415 RepID=UPI0021AF76BB|nr:UTRA domain-containing protein [Streptomyces sp. WAC00469]